jgi:hypothetical protein
MAKDPFYQVSVYYSVRHQTRFAASGCFSRRILACFYRLNTAIGSKAHVRLYTGPATIMVM